MNPDEIITGEFKAACHDYHYLLSKEYPERGSLKMVGDRYRLTHDQRSVLYRGISSEPASEARKARLIPLSSAMHLLIDGYNVLFTVLNYRLGRMVFISTDGILRDAGSLHGKLRDDHLLEECIEDLLTTLTPFKPFSVDIYLDSPVSSSNRHHQIIEQRLKDFGLPGTCSLVHSADHEIKSFNTGVLASSDTVLIEKTSVPVTDLSRLVLEDIYGATFFRIRDLFDVIKP
jgi:hypothetical protein